VKERENGTGFEFEVGEEIDCYVIEEPHGFAGVLPVARIREGFPNAGIRVILTTADPMAYKARMQVRALREKESAEVAA
jgi:hypothetical protein